MRREGKASSVTPGVDNGRKCNGAVARGVSQDLGSQGAQQVIKAEREIGERYTKDCTWCLLHERQKDSEKSERSPALREWGGGGPIDRARRMREEASVTRDRNWGWGSGPGLACAEFKMMRVSQQERPEMKSGGCEGKSSLKGGWGGGEGQSECGRGRKKRLERSGLRLGKPRCGRGCSGKQDGHWLRPSERSLTMRAQERALVW